MTNDRTNTGNQFGFSLVELMVALALGLVLMFGAVQVFTASKQTYRVNEAMSRLQENARFAMDILTRDIRQAGFMGCSSLVSNSHNGLQTVPASFNPGAGIEGWDATGTAYGSFQISIGDAPKDASASGWTTAAGSGSSLDANTDSMPNSDIIRVWRAEDELAVINNVTGTPPVVNATPFDSPVQSGDLLLLTDCATSDWVQACSAGSGAGTTVDYTLSSTCTPGNKGTLTLATAAAGQLFKLEGTTYFVGKNANDAANPPALFRRPLGNQAIGGAREELIEGVEALQILYGEDTDSDRVANRYVVADNVGNWANVVSVRLSLLMVSLEDNLTASTQTFQFNGAQVQAPDPDRRLRYVLTSTVTLRNRAP